MGTWIFVNLIGIVACYILGVMCGTDSYDRTVAGYTFASIALGISFWVWIFYVAIHFIVKLW